ncbi:MAG: hypothetical protein KKC80_00955 [Candidatus Margulisbacteria bacterium]|nr:hypothetical protein [Candidatus Margulisiibacteriota bacterium]MBU1616444.1 hypothetical protein [Candidatus Margulisiibacteriota bacterium]
MKEKNKLKIWGEVVFAGLLVILIGGQVFADGAYVRLLGDVNTNFIFNNDGTTKVPAGQSNGSVVQVVTGAISAPGAGGALAGGQTEVVKGFVGFDGATNDLLAGQFYYGVVQGALTPYYVRVWPSGIGADKMYGQSGQQTTSAPGANPDPDDIAAIVCDWKLSVPPGIICNVGNYILTYNDSLGDYLPAFTVTPTNIGAVGSIKYVLDKDNIKYAYDSISYEICKAPGGVVNWTASQTNIIKTYASGSISENSLTDPFYKKGDTYAVHASATNSSIGTGAFGPNKVFTIPAGGVGPSGAVADHMEINLKKTTDLGVNQFAYVMNTTDQNATIYFTGKLQTTTDTTFTNRTVKGLAEAIDDFAEPGTVKSIGWWNNEVTVNGVETQRMEGYTIDGSTWTGSTGTSGNGAEALKNIVYQISVSKDVNVFKMDKEQGK